MRTVLITGLDGSGKSTLLTKLEKEYSGVCEIIRVPEIDLEKFKGDPRLFKVVAFINQLNREGDETNNAQVKLIALFSSMLVFKDLRIELEKKQPRVIFYERHPLIDTGTYGRFYATQLDPDTFSKEIAAKLEAEFDDELNFILEKIGVRTENIADQKLMSLLRFLHHHFVIEKKFSFGELAALFKVEMPDKIIFLKADVDVLMSRLGSRKRREAHESKAIFEKLIPLYDKILHDSGVNLSIIPANDVSDLGNAFTEAVKMIAL